MSFRYVAAAIAAVFFVVFTVSAKPIDETVFVAFDTETTGFSSKKDRIIEIGAVKFRGKQILATASWLINPQGPIHPRAVERHGITEEMTAAAPLFAEVWPQFRAFCGDDALLLAHNASFDIRFLRAELQRAGFEIPAWQVLDTLPLFRKWYPDAPRHALDALVEYCEVPCAVRHRAGADALALHCLFRKGVELFELQECLELESDSGGLKRVEP